MDLSCANLINDAHLLVPVLSADVARVDFATFAAHLIEAGHWRYFLWCETALASDLIIDTEENGLLSS